MSRASQHEEIATVGVFHSERLITEFNAICHTSSSTHTMQRGIKIFLFNYLNDILTMIRSVQLYVLKLI